MLYMFIKFSGFDGNVLRRHRWTGRYEAHLWDKGSWNPTQRKKGKQGRGMFFDHYLVVLFRYLSFFSTAYALFVVL